MELVFANRKEHIRTVAMQLFRRYGYMATSMRNLAGEIGIEPASLYSHIKGKEEILQEICFMLADLFFEAQKNIIHNDYLNVEEKLRQAIKAHIEVITKNIDASAVFFHDWRHLGDESIKKFRVLRRDYEDLFRSIIRQGSSEGIFRKINEKFMVLTIFSAMNWTYEWYTPGMDMNFETIGNNLADVLIKGLKN
jgi:TetR/AcrR family transcriptional regulator, cholesterol catabolism regulator